MITRYTSIECDSEVVKVDDIAKRDQESAEYLLGDRVDFSDEMTFRILFGLLDDLGCQKTVDAVRRIRLIRGS